MAEGSVQRAGGLPPPESGEGTLFQGSYRGSCSNRHPSIKTWTLELIFRIRKKNNILLFPFVRCLNCVSDR
jgi:hypothetical protein